MPSRACTSKQKIQLKYVSQACEDNPKILQNLYMAYNVSIVLKFNINKEICMFFSTDGNKIKT